MLLDQLLIELNNSHDALSNLKSQEDTLNHLHKKLSVNNKKLRNLENQQIQNIVYTSNIRGADISEEKGQQLRKFLDAI